MGKYKKGFTLIETVIVLALFAIITGVTVSSIQYAAVSKRYEKKVVQYAIEDALVGYFGMMGNYPGDDQLAVGTKDYSLNEAETEGIINELNMYVGYTFGSKADILTLMKRYDFLLSYPDKYTLKIKVVDK